MDTNEAVNHLPSRKRAGSSGKEDYRALLDSTEQGQQHDFVKRTPFGVVSLSQDTKPQLRVCQIGGLLDSFPFHCINLL